MEFFRYIRKDKSLAVNFEDFYIREFCKDLDGQEPDLKASFYKINNPKSESHPVQIIAEHTARCLSNPVKKGFGAKLPTDSSHKEDRLEGGFLFACSTHCELQASNDAELRSIAKKVYEDESGDYFVTRDAIMKYIDQALSNGNLEWKKLLNSKIKWEADYQKWKKQQIIKNENSSTLKGY